MIIRKEAPQDYRAVEELAREAFWNVYGPGCDEHYFVHMMRKHSDFIPELALVATENDRIIGNIMYLKTKLISDDGIEKPVLSFGPLTVAPDYQRSGYGKKLIAHSFDIVRELGYDTVVIFGNPENYVTSGFKSCKKYNISLSDGSFPVALLVCTLNESALDGRHYTYIGSDADAYSPEDVTEFDKSFPPREKGYSTTQELFYIYSHSDVTR